MKIKMVINENKNVYIKPLAVLVCCCCCYCCCPNTSGSYCTDVIHNCNNKLLGIDLSKIKAKTIINTNPVSKPQSNIRQVNDELSGKLN